MRINIRFMIKYRVEDFLKDNNFICYVFGVFTPKHNQIEDLLKQHPALLAEAQKAADILWGIDQTFCLDDTEVVDLKQRLKSATGIV